MAEFYNVSTKRLNEQVKRNRNRFPRDFMFQLTSEEKSELIAVCDHLEKLKYPKTLPYAFTEHGAIMVASILNSPRAIEVSIFIVRAFVKLRQTIAIHKEIAHKIAQIERKLADHDQQILALIQAIKQFMLRSRHPKKDELDFTLIKIYKECITSLRDLAAGG